jgi:hypothetical protein
MQVWLLLCVVLLVYKSLEWKRQTKVAAGLPRRAVVWSALACPIQLVLKLA